MDLISLLAAEALRIAPPGKPFLLASGRESDWYLDCKALTMDPAHVRTVAAALADRIIARGWDPVGVGGLTLGADPLAYALSREALDRGLRWLPFVVRKEAKGRGTGRQVEGNLPAGARLVVLEDTTTTGGSARRAIAALRAAGHEVAGVLTLVDREQGGAAGFAADGVPFEALATGGQVREAAGN